MKQKRLEFSLHKVELEKRDHESINKGHKLTHNSKCTRDLAAWREALAKGEAKGPKKVKAKMLDGKMIKIRAIDMPEFISRA